MEGTQSLFAASETPRRGRFRLADPGRVADNLPVIPDLIFLWAGRTAVRTKPAHQRASLGPVQLSIPGLERPGIFPAQYKISNGFRPEIVPGRSSPETNGPLFGPRDLHPSNRDTNTILRASPTTW